jgi:metallo-beta-lactamase family protein
MPQKQSVLHFLGAAGSVPGSRFLMRSGDSRVLVDCGLFPRSRHLPGSREWLGVEVSPESRAPRGD